MADTRAGVAGPSVGMAGLDREILDALDLPEPSRYFDFDLTGT